MRERYGDGRRFLETFTPDLQIVAARHPERAYRGTAPTLAEIAAGYGEPLAVVWICVQLESVNLFAGAKEKMPVRRQKELAALILTEYPFLKASELLLFFYRLKCGKYGRFYGAVDALTITTALIQFADERRQELALLLHGESERRTDTQASGGGMTYDEYLRWKQQKQQQSKKQTSHEHE